MISPNKIITEETQYLKLALMLSGEGSNVRNIIRLCQDNQILKVAVVVSDKPNENMENFCGGFKIPFFVVEKKMGMNRTQHEEAILELISPKKIDWVLLAGYMRILTPYFLHLFAHPHYPVSRVVNLHPSLLPSFPGADGYRDAYTYGTKVSGVTLHLVDQGLDSGPILLQKSFNRLPDDDFDLFKKRGKELEYSIYQDFLELIVSKKININNRFIKFEEQSCFQE